MNDLSTPVADAELAALSTMARRLRRHAIRMTTAAGSGHATSAMSCAEIVTALFFRVMRWDPGDPSARDVDSFILSKGHATPALWSALYEAGAIREELNTLRRIDSSLEGHPTPNNPWVKVATGSLGQGLAAANGIALANRLDGIDANVFCLLGDGECSEGSVWEAAQFAALNHLEHLVAIVDVNGIAQSGPAPYGHDTAVLARRFKAFGWHTEQIDGHDLRQVIAALERARGGGPSAILARTEKGKGVSFLEGQAGWHGKALKPDDAERALQELGEAEIRLTVTPQRLGSRRRSHAVAPTAIPVQYASEEKVATREAFGRALKRLGDRRPQLVVLDGDVSNSTLTEYFAKAYPERFFQGYIAEQNMVGAALGLAVSGYVPVAATFACFLSRAYDQIRMAGHSRPPRLVLCGSHAGISIGEDGPSQMGLEDLALMRAVNGSTVLYPSDAVSAERLTELAVERSDGVVYLRTTRGKTPVLYGNGEWFTLGGSKVLRRSSSDRATVVAAGITVHEALAAWERLRARRINIRVIDAYSIKPLDLETLYSAARETGAVLVVEDHWPEGGLGEAVASALCHMAPVHHLAVFEEPRSGKPQELLERYGIGRGAIERKVLDMVGV